MDQIIRNKLRNVVTQSRKLLEEAVSQAFQGQFGIYATGKRDEVHVEGEARMSNLSDEDRAYCRDILDHFEHIKALGYKPKDALAQLIREIAFTHLNRLCAYKMMEARGLIRESVSRGLKSQGFLFYLADHEDDEKLYNTGKQDVAYRHFLNWLGGTLSEEIGVLFSPTDPANRLYSTQRVLDEVISLLNTGDIKPEDKELAEAWPQIWSQDETIGWVYQYFTPKELRDQARKESAAPRNSYELAFRNQFFTPRYVVEFLTDNTLGRIWYEMRKGDTKLKDQCRYMVRRPNEMFLGAEEEPPKEVSKSGDDLSQEELLKQPVYIPHRLKKDPRNLKILDPSSGSGHFLLYCFDVLETIYEEAYDDPDLGAALKKDYPTLADLRKAVPGLILSRNLYGIDIDPRCTQIAALAVWLRCQRAYQEMGLKKDRPKITRSNIVCAEPMPGEEDMLREFVSGLQPKVLGQLVDVVFEKMKLAGEAGSLLKIEEELREAIATAKKQWLQAPKQEQLILFDTGTRIQQELQFDLSGITDEEFWNEAEAKVLASLREYATKVSNGKGLQRQLFAEDAAQGFAFVDLCWYQFDVILMNPPFGEESRPAKAYIETTFKQAKHDIGMAFIARTATLLCPSGALGAITSRACLANEKLTKWRQQFLLGKTTYLTAMVDLGVGVLDEALVEVAAYILSPTRTDCAVILNCLDYTDKQAGLNTVHQSLVKDSLLSQAHVMPLRLFESVPSSILAYTLPLHLLLLVSAGTSLETTATTVKQGLQTGDDFRFYRLYWEVSQSLISTDYGNTRRGRWCPIAKGGEYDPFYSDIHLLIDWEDNGVRVKEHIVSQYPYLNGDWGWVVKNHEYYFRSGLTFPERTTSGFSPRPLPQGTLFTAVGMAIFSDSIGELLGYLLGAYARPYKLVVGALLGGGDSSVSGSAAKHIRSGLLNSLPHPLQRPNGQLTILALNLIDWRRRVTCLDETTRFFSGPFPSFALEERTGLREMARKVAAFYCAESVRFLNAFREVESQQANEWKLSREELEEVANEFGPYPSDYPKSQHVSGEMLADIGRSSEEKLIQLVVDRYGARRQLTKKEFFFDRRIELAAHLLESNPSAFATREEFVAAYSEDWATRYAECLCSFAVGCVFGRWNVRRVCSDFDDGNKVDYFAPLPVCSPAMVEGPDGLSAIQTPEGYPLRIDWDGILVDDSDHPEDIVRRVREVLELIWKSRAEAVEKEACQILGVKDLREYFRKPGAGGFWDDHVKRYSKSRRKAPIYWLLQSSKKNYALWLYYHRLDKDLLFKALLNYVEPKMRLEESRLASLRSQKAAGSESGTTKKLDKEIEKQEDLLSELGDFKDKLQRAANLHLEPDLNDGVVLNIAPLWELVPWKEAKNYWDELLEGKYEWSSIGKQLREKGLVKE